MVRLLVQQNKTLLLGGSSSAQYARCVFEFGAEQTEKTVKVEQKMIAELLTNVVVRDEYGAISSNYKDLVNAFKNLFSFNSDNVKVYSKFVTGGGFNSTWKLPIQQYSAFSRGSVIVFEDCTPQEQEVPQTGYFRDFSFGGYGRYKLRAKSDQDEYRMEDKEIHAFTDKNTDHISSEAKHIVEKIKENRDIEKTKANALKAAKCMVDTTSLSQSAAMRTYSIFLKNNSCASFKEAIHKNFKGDKNKKLLAFASNIIDIYENLEDVQKTDKIFREGTRAYLTQARRMYQQGGGGQ